MTANFCLSGSLQSTKPGQLTCIMVLYSTESQFKGGGGGWRGGKRKSSLIFIIRFVQFLAGFDAVGWVWQKSLYCGPHWFRSQCEAIEMAIGLRFAEAARADVVYLYAHHTSFMEQAKLSAGP